MCSFLSALFTSQGKLICQPVYTDSHAELIEWSGIQERNTTAPVQHFVKLELAPPGKTSDWLDVANWIEKVDGHEVPEWFDKAARFDAFAQMRGIITDAITEGDGRLTFGGLMIVASGEVRVRGGRVFLLHDSTATLWDYSIAVLWDHSTATLWNNSTATLRDHSTATLMNNSTATLMNNSTATLRNNSTATLWDHSTATLWNNSTAVLWDHSTATLMNNSTATLRDHSTAVLRDNSTATLWDHSTATLRDNATILKDMRIKKTPPVTA